ncbi:hypothetical protein GW17_00045517 [Ensete ventricosum]|nr:hypothetical protein GW17_00045517 [Ensete ventricosum]
MGDTYQSNRGPTFGPPCTRWIGSNKHIKMHRIEDPDPLLVKSHPRFAVPAHTSVPRFGQYGSVVCTARYRAVRVPVNHRTGTYRPYRAVR